MIYPISTLHLMVEEGIRKMPLDTEPIHLFEPIIYTMSLGGKRIRPMLLLMSANLFQEDVENLITPAVALEVFHNFTLLHDDVMDNADIRRGKPTVHVKWSDNTAILSGDAMLIEAYKYIATSPADKLQDVLHLFSQTAMEVCKGQQYDMDFEQRDDVSESEYIEMIRLKTAVLLACSLKMGALLSNASAKDADLLYDFGINIGLAFQLKDDLLDVFGDTAVFGKKIGGDIVSNKKTFLLIKALENADSAQREKLNTWIHATDFDPQEKIKSVTAIYEALNLKQISERLMDDYYQKGVQCLSEVSVSNDRKMELKAFAENLMYREK